MKTIKLTNHVLVPTHTFVSELSLSGLATRGKVKFMSRLEEKLKEFDEAATEIRKRYFKTKEDGSFEEKDGKLIWIDDSKEAKDKVTQELTDLENEEVEIQFGEYSGKYEALFNALENLTTNVEARYAVVYDNLLNAYEANKEEK